MISELFLFTVCMIRISLCTVFIQVQGIYTQVVHVTCVVRGTPCINTLYTTVVHIEDQ